MKKLKSKKEIKPAIVGYGMMGIEHVEIMESVGITPVAIEDKSPACRKRARKEQPHIPIYSSIRDMLGYRKVLLHHMYLSPTQRDGLSVHPISSPHPAASTGEDPRRRP